MIAMDKTNQRGFLVPHPAQKELFIRISWILLSLLVVSGSLFYFLAQQRLEAEYFKAHSQINNVMEMLLPWMITVFTIGILASSLLTFLVSKHLSGPLVNFKKSLANISSGDMTTKIDLREHDHYQELANSINLMVTKVADDYQHFESSLKEIDSALNAIHINADDTNSSTQQQLISQSLETMKRRLAERKF